MTLFFPLFFSEWELTVHIFIINGEKRIFYKQKYYRVRRLQVMKNKTFLEL